MCTQILMMYLDVLLAIAALIGPKSSSNVTAQVFRFLADTKNNNARLKKIFQEKSLMNLKAIFLSLIVYYDVLLDYAAC